MKLTSISSPGMFASLASYTQGPLSVWIGEGQSRRIGFWEGGMKCCFIYSSGAKSLESRLVAERLASCHCWYRVGVEV